MYSTLFYICPPPVSSLSLSLFSVVFVCFSIFADCFDSALHDSGQWRTRRRWSGRRGGGWRAQAPVLTKMMTPAPLPLLETHLPARAPLGQTPQVKCPKAPTGCSHSLVKQICHVGLIRCLNTILFLLLWTLSVCLFCSFGFWRPF